MTAIEDPVPQLSSEAAGTDPPREDLEQWLSGLRTGVTADPSGWTNEDSGRGHRTGEAVEPGPQPPGRRDTGKSEPSRGGRHRTPD